MEISDQTWLVDSEIYTHLLHTIAPFEVGVTKEALMESDAFKRAEIMLQQVSELKDSKEIFLMELREAIDTPTMMVGLCKVE